MAQLRADPYTRVASLSRDERDSAAAAWAARPRRATPEAGMRDGVARSHAVVLFLNAGALARPWVQLEVRAPRGARRDRGG